MVKDVGSLFSDGLIGRHAHVDPGRALKGLSAEMARKVPGEGVHSIWDHLYHMVFWQDVIDRALNREEIKLRSIGKKDWPKTDQMTEDGAWETLVVTFFKQLKKLQQVLRNREVHEEVPLWSGGSVAMMGMLIVQHNSYHLGQIVLLRKLLGYWPPPKTK